MKWLTIVTRANIQRNSDEANMQITHFVRQNSMIIIHVLLALFMRQSGKFEISHFWLPGSGVELKQHLKQRQKSLRMTTTFYDVGEI